MPGWFLINDHSWLSFYFIYIFLVIYLFICLFIVIMFGFKEKGKNQRDLGNPLKPFLNFYLPLNLWVDLAVLSFLSH